ncbi:MAG TPA: tetratricopeptide repeat protein [Vicinamibacterales bacterium]|nr:hypothetical protein [Acidobacteriota bacterium]HJO37518.1 tetratricopeptide repeat protein [Vicinamibacterales bacterium]
MKQYTLRWFIVLLVALAVPAAVTGQDWKGRVDLDGKVTNADGVGLPQTTVTAIFVETGTGPDPETADGDGEFELDDLKPGAWRITIAAGHLGYGAEILELDVAERDNDDIEVVLPTLQELLDQATADFGASNFSGARASYEKIFAALPANVDLHQAIAATYQGEGLHAEALGHYDALLEAWEGGAPAPTPESPGEVILQAMLSAGSAGQYDRMHGYIDDLDDPLPADAETAFIDLSGNTLMDAEEFDHAVRVLGVAIDRAPNSALPYYYRGMAHIRLENDDEAIADFNQFVELSPSETPQVTQAKDLLTKLQPQ